MVSTRSNIPLQNVAADFWRLLVLLEIMADYWKVLEITADSCSYCRLLELLEITEDYWRLLEITGKYWRLLENTADYWNFYFSTIIRHIRRLAQIFTTRTRTVPWHFEIIHYSVLLSQAWESWLSASDLVLVPELKLLHNSSILVFQFCFTSFQCEVQHEERRVWRGQ